MHAVVRTYSEKPRRNYWTFLKRRKVKLKGSFAR